MVKGDAKLIKIRIYRIGDIDLKRKRNRGIRNKTRRYQGMRLARVDTEDALNGNVYFRRIIKDERAYIRTKKNRFIRTKNSRSKGNKFIFDGNDSKIIIKLIKRLDFRKIN